MYFARYLTQLSWPELQTLGERILKYPARAWRLDCLRHTIWILAIPLSAYVCSADRLPLFT
jgi:hypothetical protein